MANVPENLDGETANVGGLFGIISLNGVRITNRALMVVSLFFALWTIYRASQAGPQGTLVNEHIATALRSTGEVESLRSTAYYLQLADERNIFKPILASQAEERAAQEDPRKRLEEFARDLQVQGVSWDDPDMVMAYDRRQKKMLFLKQSQKIGNTEIEVREVSADRVKLGLEDAEIEIFTRPDFRIKER
jgi:hypothetical protein